MDQSVNRPRFERILAEPRLKYCPIYILVSIIYIFTMTSDHNVTANTPVPDSEMIVTTVDENIIVNEIIAEQSPSEETRGEFFFSLDEWGSITQSEGDSIVFSKDWTNLFSSKLEGLFTYVLCFKYKNKKLINHKVGKMHLKNVSSFC